MIRTAILACTALALTACASLPPLTAQPGDTVETINARINRYGAADPGADARAADGSWDCEDYAFTKLAALQSAGLAPGAYVQGVFIGRGQAHAVVALPDGTVMDSLFARPMSKAVLEKDHGYRFTRRMANVNDQQMTDWAAIFADAERARK